jgi:hypothetical protein
VEIGELRTAYEAIRAEARAIAGAPGDIVPRVVAHHALYRDSLGNHAFPMVALHGALWGYDFFEVTGKLGEIVSYRYVFDADEKAKRHAMLGRFAEGFKAVNREVFVDTFTNYHFTARHGRAPGAEALVHPELLDALNEVHAAKASGRALDVERKRHVFERSLRFEQEITVAPGIARELAAFDCPILRALCMKPVVRFAYFGVFERFFFGDFSDKGERIERAIASFDIACERGWDHVERSMMRYGAPLEGRLSVPLP